MICPVFVASEMSGLKSRARIVEHSQGRTADALISGPSFGTGHEDQGSFNSSDEWADHVDAGSRDHWNIGSEHEAMESSTGGRRLQRFVRPAHEEAEPEACGAGHSRAGSAVISRALLRSECEAFCRETASGARDPLELQLGQDGIA